jgi:shikimate dehydrogenase
MELEKFLENEPELDFNATDFYTTIIGISPSKGARSPSLWNKVFRNQSMSAMMHAVDVQPENLEPLINALKNDSQFLGGAVAVPYKTEIMSYLDIVEPAAKIIAAVNCIYRNCRGQLVGANTDGEGAVKSLENVIKKKGLLGSSVLVIGIGGAGRAVATNVAYRIGHDGQLYLANRTRQPSEALARALHNLCEVEILELPLPMNFIESIDVIINCSIVGYQIPVFDNGLGYCLQPYTPLSKVDTTIRVKKGENFIKRYIEGAQSEIEHNIHSSISFLGHVQPHAMIFDIIYQPHQTMLLQLASCFGLSTLNGMAMNMEQAVLAFSRVIPEQSDLDVIRNIMRS